MINFVSRHRVWLLYLPFVLYWAALLTATTIPGVQVEETIEYQDKFAHLGGYFILAVLMYLTFLVQRRFPRLYKRPAAFTLLVSTLYGIADEVHQLYIPGRSGDIIDFAADLLGVLLAITILSIIKKKTTYFDILEKKELQSRSFTGTKEP